MAKQGDNEKDKSAIDFTLVWFGAFRQRKKTPRKVPFISLYALLDAIKNFVAEWERFELSRGLTPLTI
jgi:hypothetical protein